tara:strand:- start:32870 stop:33592 length:723 start_codon:yes stop_codon:yes gene_type:complete
MKWFKHDTDANMDAKLQEVMLDYGLEGYGLYWYCIELIAQRVNGDNLTFELEHDCRIIARNTGSTPQKVEQMMKSFIKLGLLNADNGHVFCLKLASRCDDFTAKAVRRNGIKTVINQSVGVTPSLSAFVHLEEEVRKRSKKNISNIHQQIADSWNEVFKDELPSVSKVTQKRKSAINGCIAEMKGTGNDFSILQTWTDLFVYAKGLDFLMGRKTDWSMSFDFITTKSKLIKLVEGEYDNK